MSIEKVNNNWTIDKFRKWISEKIDIYFTENDKRTARIKEVKAIGKQKDDERQSFSLTMLTSMTEQYYTQGTFRVVLPDEQEAMMFMVPVGLDAEKTGMQYEVIYN